MTSGGRYAAWRFGLRGERWAAWLLVLKGYRILARRFQSSVGEIDIVAKRGGMVCFVEVKARASEILETPVSPRQMQRICRASLAFLQARPGLSGLQMRYDVILIGRWRWPLHLRDVWRP